MRILTISDTHNQKFKLPEADICLHAGDLTMMGTREEVEIQLKWLNNFRSNFKHGIYLTPGNHDWLFEKKQLEARALCEYYGIELLMEESVTIEGIKIYMSPYQTEFFNWAFNVKPSQILQKHWQYIPEDTQILVTHGQPYGINDLCLNGHVGDPALLTRIEQLKDLKVYIGGHIHESAGYTWYNNKLFVNSAVLNGRYRPLNYCYLIEYSETPQVEKLDLPNLTEY